MADASQLNLSKVWRKAALEVDLPFGLTPRGRVLCADVAVRVVLMALRDRIEELQAVQDKYGDTAGSSLLGIILSELVNLEHTNG